MFTASPLSINDHPTNSNDEENSETTSTADRLQVYYRIRPPNKTEREQGFSPLFETTNDQYVCVNGGKKYSCDGLLSSQMDVYDRVGKKALDLALQGYSAGVMCYGQTGTGKTHTMCHDVEPDLGLIPRIAVSLFDALEGRSDAAVTLQVIQIYRDNLQDLAFAAMQAEGLSDNMNNGSSGTPPTTPPPDDIELQNDPYFRQKVVHKDHNKLDLRYDDKTGVEILNAKTIPVGSAEDFLALFRAASQCRATAATKMNATSSRSHVAFICCMSYRDAETKNLINGKLLLVDLAGYERFGKTDIRDEIRKDEARAINASLLALGNVIQSLAEHTPHVPWRNSKLTRLMQDCVGGKAQTSLILTMGPSDDHMHETMGTLFFGSRAMNVAISSSQDVAVNHEAQAARLQQLLEDAHQRISQLETENRTTSRELAAMERRMNEEIDKLQDEHRGRISEMLMKGESADRIQRCVKSFSVELEAVLEQQMEQRSFSEFVTGGGEGFGEPLLSVPSFGACDLAGNTGQVMQSAQFERADTSSSIDLDLGLGPPQPSTVSTVAPGAGVGTGAASVSALAQLKEEYDHILTTAEEQAQQLRDRTHAIEQENAALKAKLSEKDEDLEDAELELSVERGKTHDLSAQVEALEAEMKSMERRIELAEEKEDQQLFRESTSFIVESSKRRGSSPPPSLPSSASRRTRADSILSPGAGSPAGFLSPTGAGEGAVFSASPLRASVPIARLEQAQTLRRMMIQTECANAFASVCMQLTSEFLAAANSGTAIITGSLGGAVSGSAAGGLLLADEAEMSGGGVSLTSYPNPSSQQPQHQLMAPGGGGVAMLDLSAAIEQYNAGWVRLNMTLEDALDSKSALLERSTKLVMASIARTAHQLKKEYRQHHGEGGAEHHIPVATPETRSLETVPLQPHPAADSNATGFGNLSLAGSHTRTRSSSECQSYSGIASHPGSFASGSLNNLSAMGSNATRSLREQIQQRPESHRMWLFSGRLPESDQGRTTAGKQQQRDRDKTPLRPQDVLQSSIEWNSTNDLDEYRSFMAYHFYVLGDHHTGKTSFIHCLSHKAPTFFKRLPSVQTPTIGIQCTMHKIANLTSPCPSVQHGGMTEESQIPIDRMLKESAATTSFNVELCEMPSTLLRSMTPGALPCRGAAYFLVYSLLDDVAASRRHLEETLIHLYTTLTAGYQAWHNDEQAELNEEREARGYCSGNSGTEDNDDSVLQEDWRDRQRRKQLNRYPILQVPCILVGTSRDQWSQYNKKDHDDSKVQASLRSQREWFERFITTFTQSTDMDNKTNIRFNLLDSFAVSHASWELSGERPRSANTFDGLLQDTVRYLSVHSPISPLHLLPTEEMLLRTNTAAVRGKGPWDSPPSICLLDVFWSTRTRMPLFGSTTPSSASLRVATGGKPTDAELAEELRPIAKKMLHRAAIGVVTLATTLERWREFAGHLSDYYVFDNLVRTHFGFTLLNNKKDSPSSTGVDNQHEKNLAPYVAALQNRIVRYFLRWSLSMGLIELFESAEEFAVVGLRSSWRDAVLTRLLLPAAIDDAVKATGRAAIPERQEGHLLDLARERWGVDFEVSTTKSELPLYHIGQLTLKYLQRSMVPPLDAVGTNAETAYLILSALGLARPGAAPNARRFFFFGESLPGRLEFFFPAALRTASETICNMVGYAMNVIAEGALLEGIVTLYGDAQLLFQLVLLDLAASGEVSLFHCWANATCFFHRDGAWVFAARRGSEIHICMMFVKNTTSEQSPSPLREGWDRSNSPTQQEGAASESPPASPSSKNALRDIFEWIAEAFTRCASLYPCTHVECTHSIRRPSVFLWDSVECTTKEILASVPHENVQRLVNIMRDLMERTCVEPRLDMIIQYVDGVDGTPSASTTGTTGGGITAGGE